MSSPRTLGRLLAVAAAALALTAAGVAVNLALLRYADRSDSQVGRLSPQATLIRTPATPTGNPPSQPAAPTTQEPPSPPATSAGDHDEAEPQDDD